MADLKELRQRKREQRLEQRDQREVQRLDANRSKLQANAAKAREKEQASRLSFELAQYEQDNVTTVCFLCAKPILAEDEAVGTALGNVHQYCYLDSQEDDDD